MCNVYMMYYTDVNNGTEFQSCGYLCNAEQNRAYPADSTQPLPSNPTLEAYAIHGKRNHELRTSSTISDTDPIIYEIGDHHKNEEHQLPVEQQDEVIQVTSDVQQGHEHQHLHVKQDQSLAMNADLVKGQTRDEKANEAVIKTVNKELDVKQKRREDHLWSIFFFIRRFFS